MKIVKLGDFIVNFDEVLYIKRVGLGARIKFKGGVQLDGSLRREDILEIAKIPEKDWDNISQGGCQNG